MTTSWKRLDNILKISWTRLEDVWPRQIFWSWSRRLENALKTSSEDVWVRRRYLPWSRRLLKPKTNDVFKTSSRRLHQDECLLGCNKKLNYFSDSCRGKYKNFMDFMDLWSLNKYFAKCFILVNEYAHELMNELMNKLIS